MLAQKCRTLLSQVQNFAEHGTINNADYLTDGLCETLTAISTMYSELWLAHPGPDVAVARQQLETMLARFVAALSACLKREVKRSGDGTYGLSAASGPLQLPEAGDIETLTRTLGQVIRELTERTSRFPQATTITAPVVDTELASLPPGPVVQSAPSASSIDLKRESSVMKAKRESLAQKPAAPLPALPVLPQRPQEVPAVTSLADPEKSAVADVKHSEGLHDSRRVLIACAVGLLLRYKNKTRRKVVRSEDISKDALKQWMYDAFAADTDIRSLPRWELYHDAVTQPGEIFYELEDVGDVRLVAFSRFTSLKVWNVRRVLHTPNSGFRDHGAK